MVDEWSDAEMVDNLDYTLFPNLHPWGAYNRIVYRFRPNGDDHRSAIMEVMFLAPFTGERPPPAPVHQLGVDEPWTDAPELGVLGKVFEQDTFNMAAGAARPRDHGQAGHHARPTTRRARCAGSHLKLDDGAVTIDGGSTDAGTGA